MNTRKRRIMMAAVLITVAISAPSLFAQTPAMSANIPFDFYISDRLFPAGTYTVAPQARADAIRISDNRGNSAYVMTMGLTDNKLVNNSRLVFNRYGDTSFLTSIFWAGYKSGRNLPASKIEKRLAQNVSPSNPVAVQLAK